MRIAIALALVAVTIAAPQAGERRVAVHTERGCGRWSIKGLELGMTLGEFKEAHSKAKRGRNWFRPADRGRDWYVWAESRLHGVYNYVLPEAHDDSASIVSVVALIDMSETSPSHVVDALVERWGPPIAREVPVGEVRYYNAFGAPRGEVEWKATTWQDESCDLLVTVLDRPVIAELLGTKTEMFMVSLDSISKLVTRAEERRSAAREAARP